MTLEEIIPAERLEEFREDLKARIMDAMVVPREMLEPVERKPLWALELELQAELLYLKGKERRPPE